MLAIDVTIDAISESQSIKGLESEHEDFEKALSETDPEGVAEANHSISDQTKETVSSLVTDLAIGLAKIAANAFAKISKEVKEAISSIDKAYDFENSDGNDTDKDDKTSNEKNCGGEMGRKLVILLLMSLLFSVLFVFLCYSGVPDDLILFLGDEELYTVDDFLGVINKLYLLACGSRVLNYFIFLVLVSTYLIIFVLYLRSSENLRQKIAVFLVTSISLFFVGPKLWDLFLHIDKFTGRDLRVLASVDNLDVLMAKVKMFSEKSISIYERSSIYLLKVQLLFIAIIAGGAFLFTKLKK